MRDEEKSKEQLTRELVEARARIAALESADRADRTDWLKAAEPFARLQRDLAVALNASLHLSAAIKALLDSVTRMSGFEGAAFYLAAEDGGLELAGSRGLSESFVATAQRFEAGTSQALHIMAGVPLYTHRDQLPPDRLALCRQEGLRAVAVLPIHHEGRPVACLTVASRSLDEVPTATRDALEAISVQAGAAIARLTAEQAVRENEERMRVGLEGSNVGLWDWNLTNNQVTFVRHWAELLGYPAEEIEPHPFMWQRHVHPDDREAVRRAIKDHLAGRSPLYENIHRLRSKSGEWRWILARGKVVRRDRQGKPLRLVGMYMDVTAYHQAEEALRLRGEVINNMAEGVAIAAAGDRQIIYTNPTCDAMFGYAPDELTGRELAVLVAPQAEPFRQSLAAALERYGRWRGEIRTVRKDGTLFWCRASISTLESTRFGHVWVAVYADITERKEAEAAVLREHKRLERLLALHERDRQLIAYEIHDGLTQKIVGAKLLLDSLRELIAADDGSLRGQFDSAVRLVSQAIDDARTLINGVRPPILDEAGLIAAIEHLACESPRPGGPDIRFRHDVAFRRLAAPLESAVFRIVQESLTNACRHSQSPLVRVAVIQRDARLHVEIEDWGIGFDPNDVPADRFGLEGIRQRAQVFGGQASIDSAPGRGTRINVELPIIEPE